ncbi:uncharacterized protein LOC110185990 isoform X2 [Drosophila serrata]|uniref:uncharacterized protein LOC110185990 isoform X2 n=1 Tax=Drosophila serrata TaxID=7274 RepID=UPI000A1D1EAC|nr:uncharacterized protein LOC110185990 isoform X2 [Drosophila serrata]
MLLKIRLLKNLKSTSALKSHLKIVYVSLSFIILPSPVENRPVKYIVTLSEPNMDSSLGPNVLSQRSSFLGLIKKVSSPASALGNSPIAGTGIGFKMGRKPSTLEAEKRAARVAKAANVKPARLYLRSTSRGLRRAVDIYMPLFKEDASGECSEEEQEDEPESQPEVHETAPVPPLTEELSYRRIFTPRLGICSLMDECVNGASSRAKIPYTISSIMTRNIAKKLLTGNQIFKNHNWKSGVHLKKERVSN